LPMDCITGKFLLFGTAFGVEFLDDILTITAGINSRSVFTRPTEESAQEEAERAHKDFAAAFSDEDGVMGASDPAAMLEAYKAWDSLPTFEERTELTMSQYMSSKALEAMSIEKRSVLKALSDANILVSSGHDVENMMNTGYENSNDGVAPTLKQYGEITPLTPSRLAALLVLSFGYTGQIAIASAKDTSVQPKVITQDPATGEDMTVGISRNSVLGGEKTFNSPYLIFEQRVASLYTIRMVGVTPIPPLVMAIYGPGLEEQEDGTLVIDGWIKMSVSSTLKESILTLRRQVDRAFTAWIETDAWSDKEFKEAIKMYLTAVSAWIDAQKATPPLQLPRSPQEIRQSMASEALTADPAEVEKELEEIKKVHDEYLSKVDATMMEA